MPFSTRASASLLRRRWAALPTGRLLPDELWTRRHRAIVALLWVHALGIAGFALAVGEGPAHALLEAAPVGAAAWVAGGRTWSRGLRSVAATTGVITASAVLVHLSGGVIEMHFHFFVMIGVITLYQDWKPFLLALGYVVLHHGIMGAFAPTAVYNHPAAWNSPWKWSLIHGLFVLAASVAHVVSWRLNEQGFQDQLTMLANRSLFEDRLRHAIARAGASGAQVSVLFLDLDDFKTVNDGLGHAAGDEMLIAVAHRIRDCLRPADTAARLGGDEFAVLLDGAGLEQAGMVAARIRGVLQAPLVLCGRELFVAASIGIADNSGGQSAEEVLRNADAAMYAAKHNGKGHHQFFHDSMHTTVVNRLELRGELQHAVERGEFTLYYQPTFELDGDRLVGVEALVRWQHPRRGLVSPGDFIPLAEESGLIVPIGRWVLTEACHQVQAWNRERPGESQLKVNVNLSARQLRAPELVSDVTTALASSGLDPQNLVLEITESVLVHNPEEAIATLGQLKALGLLLAIDDFGTGYSSLNYLQRFPVDMLKIDKSFIDTIVNGPEESALARAIVKLGPTLGMQVTAEGIETAAQRDVLSAIDCNLGQGFYFSQPLAAEELVDRWLGDQAGLTAVA